MNEPSNKHLEQIDRALAGLPRADAPDQTVEETLRRVHRARNEEHVPSRFREKRWADGMAAAVVMFAAVGIGYQLFSLQDPVLRPESYLDESTQVMQEKSEAYEADVPVPPEEEPAALRTTALDELEEQAGAAGNGPLTPVASGEDRKRLSRQDDDSGQRIRRDEPAKPKSAARGAGDAAAPEVASNEVLRDLSATDGDGWYRGPGAREGFEVGAALEKADDRRAAPSPTAPSVVGGKVRANGTLGEMQPATPPVAPRQRYARDAMLASADQFLARYRELDGVQYQPPAGYWANTFVPGDPAIRRLEAQLRTRFPEALQAMLERGAQPFDAPDTAALAVYLHASRAQVDGPARLQLQVGLKAAEYEGGHRPPMHVAVVLHLPAQPDTGMLQRIRALLAALNRQRRSSDRFAVTIAGTPGGTVITPDDFRHGTITSLIDGLADSGASGEAWSLSQSLEAAMDRLAGEMNEDLVLGSSLVLLVAADSIASDQAQRVVQLAHTSAVAGMPVSAVSLQGDANALEPLVLAGQGRLLTLASPAEADALVDAELHAGSRTVARAIRLRIRLAEGVRLVDVIGSERLDERAAARVREAELSIDNRLARDWGIDTDRGEDEEGIQIVIPAMPAGETHVILLDLVVDGAGPVADVRARYKDLVHLKNGVARASLDLPETRADRPVRGPLENNVLRNLVAWETARAAREAAALTARGEIDLAARRLEAAAALLADLRSQPDGLAGDPVLGHDAARLTGYAQRLRALDDDPERRELLAAALEYVAYGKLLPVTPHED